MSPAKRLQVFVEDWAKNGEQEAQLTMDVERLLAAAIAEEREACAVLADGFGEGRAVFLRPGQEAIWKTLAAAIRARGSVALPPSTGAGSG